MARFRQLCGSQMEASAVLAELAALLPSAEQQVALQSAIQAVTESPEPSAVTGHMSGMQHSEPQPSHKEGGTELLARMSAASVAATERSAGNQAPILSEGTFDVAGASGEGTGVSSADPPELDASEDAGEGVLGEYDTEAPGSLSSRYESVLMHMRGIRCATV